MTDSKWVSWNDDEEKWDTIQNEDFATSSNATQIQGRDVDTATPDNGDALIWNVVTSKWEPSPVSGGGPSPSATVASETSFGVTATAGTSATYSRGDHTHGTPAAPSAASVGADPAGSASAVAGDLSTHEGLANPHGTDYADVGADAAGTAATAVSSHAGLLTGVHGAGASTLATTANIATHAGLSSSVHGFDSSGNAPPQSHGNSAHSSTFIVAADVTYANLNASGGVGTGASQVLPSTVFSGTAKITVGTSAPVGPATGDIWIDTN